MGNISSMLRLLSARLKTTLSGGVTPESMKRMHAAEASPPPLPDANLSFWVDSTRDAACALPVLPRDAPLADVDVAVLGGGIVGITTAYLLRKQGIKARRASDARACVRRACARATRVRACAVTRAGRGACARGRAAAAALMRGALRCAARACRWRCSSPGRCVRA